MPGIGRRIQAARKERGLSAQNVADMCQQRGARLSRGTLAKIEAGVRQDVTATEIAVLAQVLGMSTDELLGLAPATATERVRRLAPMINALSPQDLRLVEDLMCRLLDTQEPSEES